MIAHRLTSCRRAAAFVVLVATLMAPFSPLGLTAAGASTITLTSAGDLAVLAEAESADVDVTKSLQLDFAGLMDWYQLGHPKTTLPWPRRPVSPAIYSNTNSVQRPLRR